MELKDTGQDSMELGFDIPDPGISIMQFEEGVTRRTNENSGKTTLQLPMTIDTVIEGPKDNAGKKMSHFVPIETSFGEKQLAGLLTMTGLMSKFANKFGGDVDITDDRFINSLKLKLPGCFIKVHHDIRKNPKGNDQVNIMKFERMKAKTKEKAGKSKAKGEEDEESGDDW